MPCIPPPPMLLMIFNLHLSPLLAASKVKKIVSIAHRIAVDVDVVFVSLFVVLWLFSIV